VTSLFVAVGVLITASLVVLSSVSAHLFLLQLVWVLLGAGIILLFLFVDWHFLINYRWVIGGIYLLAILLLVFVYFKGPLIRNVRSWIVWGPFNFQPVELAKVALILLYASYFSRRHLGIARWKNIIGSFIFFAVPAGLTAIQPDLGSVLVLFGIWFGFLLVSGLPRRRIIVSLIIFAIAGFFIWSNLLKDYQRERVVGFFYPEKNSMGINYSVIQSKIAIGSAGFLGKGYGQGSQTQLGFLTEPASDFILAALIEEWGIIGGLVVVAAFLFMIFQILKIGALAERNFEKFICLGVAVVFGVHFLLNTCSELGLMPVIGVTLPFLSYGGSSILTNFFLLAIVNAIRRQP